MTTLLVEHAEILVTMDDQRREIPDGALFVRNGAVVLADSTRTIRRWLDTENITPDQIISAKGSVITPGLVNCHHHLYQTLTRTLGTGHGLSLFNWLKTLYPIWGQMDAEAVYTSAKVGIAELLLSGATTIADHLYLFPNGSRLDDEIAAAQELGVRFHPTRGSMSLGESQGGLPPDSVCQSETEILDDSQRVIEQHHDAERFSMLRIGLAPCSPFSVTADLMRQSAALARCHRGVNLHTHLAETIDEDRFCEERFGLRPVPYMESLGWLGEDVWFAHMVHPSETDINTLAQTETGVCHCPSSNMILASGIAPIRQMVDAGIRIAIGVDGSASNDGNHMLGEARQAMLLQRVGWPGFESSADRFTARDALSLATRGGAQVLNRDDIGHLAPGMAADFVAFRVDDLPHAGSLVDPVASLLTCTPAAAWLSVINGQIVVEDGEIKGIEIPRLVEQHNRLSHQLLAKAGKV